jgi:hypothetical protein
MPAGLHVAIALLAQAASGAPNAPAPVPVPAPVPANPAPVAAAAPAKPVYGPVLPAVRKPAVKAAGTTDTCAQIRADTPSREIVVCAQQGYRLNPDVMEAKREARNGGPPRRPENYKYNNCATVGPMGCMGQNQPMINLIYAATTLATMMDRLSKGQEIGSMFKTTPTPTEYELYVEAKHRREAKEAEAAAIAAAKAKAAQPASPTPPEGQAASSAPSAVQAQPAAAEPAKSTH